MNNNKNIPFSEIEIDNGFWLVRQKINAESTVPQVYRQFDKTDRFRCVASRLRRPFVRSHIFYDSDTAKWIEAAAYVLTRHRAEHRDLEKQCDDIIEDFARLQNARGYVNSYYQRHLKIKFSNRDHHELYCCGHLTEAAIAYYHATGKRKMLDMVEKYIEYIRKRFIVKHNTAFSTPGHEEIELALLRLYEETGREKNKDMAEFFINTRGTIQEKTPMDGKAIEKYDQHHLPVRLQTKAEGHAVRAMYLYSGMADLARITRDEELYRACRTVYQDILTKMYVTGGVGSSYMGEAFTVSYDLPNLTAYTETCASIGLILFARRMLKIENDVSYADTVEKVMYNGLLSGVSLDGKAFFYENPLEIKLNEFTKHTSIRKPDVRLPITERVEVFGCSCCPPNIARQIASVADVMYTEDEENIYLHQYIGSTLQRGKETLKITTDYPKTGVIDIIGENVEKKLVLRIPSWCERYTLEANGSPFTGKAENGYIRLGIGGNFRLRLTLDMQPKYLFCNPLSEDNRGKAALSYGPVIYCAEGVDNGDLTSFRIDLQGKFEIKESEYGLPVFDAEADELFMEGTYSFAPATDLRKKKIRFIPYFAFANRGRSDMKVWLPYIS